MPFSIDGKITYRCPISEVTDISWEYIGAYSLYKKGFLPHGNGWLGESKKFLNAMMLINSEVNKIELEKSKPKGRKHGNSKNKA